MNCSFATSARLLLEVGGGFNASNAKFSRRKDYKSFLSASNLMLACLLAIAPRAFST